MKRSCGFTLIELLIVISIILIIAAISVPALVHAKINADEAATTAAIRTINTAEVTYQATYPMQGFAATLANLGGAEPCKRSAETACIIDQGLAAGTKSGYNFVAIGGNPASGANTSYVVSAAPVAYERTGIQLFCSTEKNIIRHDANTSGSTTPASAEQCLNFAAMP